MELSSILSLVTTKSQQTEALNLIEKLLSELYKNNDKNKTQNQNIINASPLYQEILKTIQAQNISDNKTQVEKFLNSLMDAIKKLNLLKISIAIEPNQEMTNSLKIWLNKNKVTNTILDFEVNPGIIGGAIISGEKGTYADFSILKKINDVFLNQKQEILKLL